MSPTLLSQRYPLLLFGLSASVSTTYTLTKEKKKKTTKIQVKKWGKKKDKKKNNFHEYIYNKPRIFIS